MHVAITAVAMRTGGAVEIANHGECNAGIAGKVLPQAKAGGRDALIAVPDPLQPAVLRPESIYARFQFVDAMRVQIELHKTCAANVGGKRLGRNSENGRKLR